MASHLFGKPHGIRSTKEKKPELTPEELEAQEVAAELKRREEYVMVEELLTFDAKTRNDVKLREEDFFKIENLENKNQITQLPRCKPNYRAPRFDLISNDIATSFTKKYPFFRKVDMKNLFIAGGSVSRFVLFTAHSHPSDIDIFVCGIKTPEEAEDRVREFVKSIQKRVSILSITRSEFAITIRTEECPIQIILRLYASPSEVLHGFDLGSCMVGIWEGEAYTTRLGKFSFENRCNILNLPRRSTTYERRLYKYCIRGFDIVLPDFNMTLEMGYRADGFQKAGYCIWNTGKKLEIRNSYRRKERSLMENRRISDYAVEGPKTAHKINLERISRWNPGEPFPQLVRVSKVFDMEADDMAEELFNTSVKGISDYMIDHLFEKANITDGKNVSVRKRDVYLPGVSLDLIYEIVQSGKPLDDLLEQSKKTFKEKMALLMKEGRIPVNWIITDPGTQLCGSFNPTVMTKEDWYDKFLLKQ